MNSLLPLSLRHRGVRLGVCLLLLLGLGTMASAQVMPTSPIGVESPSGAMTYYDDLDAAFAAVKEATAEGHTIYIPTGSYSLSSDERVKLNKRVTIFGSGGSGREKTVIVGNIVLLDGADRSLISGLRVNGNIYVAENTTHVAIRHCVVNGSISFYAGCAGGGVHNCAVSGSIYGSDSPLAVSNTVMSYASAIKNGSIINCIATSSVRPFEYFPHSYSYYDCHNTRIENCIAPGHNSYGECTHNLVARGMDKADTDIAMPEGKTWADVFVKYNESDRWDPEKNDWRIKDGAPGDNAGTDGRDVGVAGGSGFDASMRSPMPRITIVEAPVRTDAEGKLRLRIRVDQE